MKICIILNPNAGTAAQFEQLREGLHDHPDVVCRVTEGPGSIHQLVRQAADQGFEVIAAAGGDGTINAVVNAIEAIGAGSDMRLGVIPLGTGNDLARTLAIPTDPEAAIDLLITGAARKIDLIQVDSEAGRAYAINMAAGGFSGQVDEIITPEMKNTWGPLAYLLGFATALPDLTRYRTLIAFDDEPDEEIDAFNIVVANGRTVAGGKRVAPLANPEDGLLDVIVVRSVSALNLAEVAARFLVGNYLDSKSVMHRQARRVRITASPGMWFNIDGELHTKEPATFSALHRSLWTIVGADYSAEPG